jgi:uncharacterized protein YlxW (UPF0749 family)
MELLKLLVGKSDDEKEMIIRNHADDFTPEPISYKLPLSDEEVKKANERHASLDISLEDAMDEYKTVRETWNAKIKEMKQSLATNRKIVRTKAIDAKGIVATVIDQDAKTIYEVTLQGKVISQRQMKKHETQQLSMTSVEPGGVLQEG